MVQWLSAAKEIAALEFYLVFIIQGNYSVMFVLLKACLKIIFIYLF